MSKKLLKIQLPEDYVSALNRRHNGANHTKEEIKKEYKHLKHLYKGYCRNRDRLNWLLNEYWDEEKIEEHFMEQKWDNAHKRRQYAEDNMQRFHRHMFASLTSFDGNSGQEYIPGVISADEIMSDFERKYIND